MKNLKLLSLILVASAFSNLAVAQGTFEKIVSTFQTSCTFSTCHDATSPAGLLDLTGSTSDVLGRLVNQDPTNPAAAGRGYKLVDPGHPYNSFLLKKIGHSFDDALALESDEGSEMPVGTSLADGDIELVRQWIYHGANENGTIHNEQAILDYYTLGGVPRRTPVPAPNPSEGFQIHMGPVFLTPGEEIEYLKKERLYLPGEIEVTRLDGNMNWQSHHFLFFRFDDGGADQEVEGFRRVNLIVNPFDGEKELTTAWQYSGDFELPTNTAFHWDETTVMDLDYHIINYNPDSIMAADMYINVYFEGGNAGNTEMRAQLDNDALLFLLPGQNTRTMTWDNDGSMNRNIWMLSSHTHKFGTDFDIYETDENGNRVDQIYEGWMNEDHTAPLGYYDWEHPPIKYFDPMYTIAPGHGLEYEATWDNTSGSFVTFGLTSNEEMFLVTYLYTESPVSGVSDPISLDDMKVFPNPSSGKFQIAYELNNAEEVEIELVNMLGERVAILDRGFKQSGLQQLFVEAMNTGVTNGVYFVKLNIGDRSSVRKIIIN